MSNPGMQMTPQQMQQRQLQMAQMLQNGMTAQAPQQADPTTPYAGVENAGNSIMQAMNYKNLAQQNTPQAQMLQQRYGNSITPSQAGSIAASGTPGLMSRIGSYFGLGGS